MMDSELDKEIIQQHWIWA